MNAKRLWQTVFFLGFLFDILFWKKAPGISFPLFIALVLLCGILLLAEAKIRPNKRALGLILPIGFFSTMSFLRAEPLTRFLDFWLSFVFLAFFALSYRSGRWLEYSLSDYIVGIFRLGFNALGRPVSFINETRPARKQAENTRETRRFVPILRGLLVAIPIVAIFASLLSSADIIFAKRLNDFIAVFRLENLPEYVFRGILILIIAYLLAGVFLYAARKSQDEKLIGEENPLLMPFLGFTEASIILGSVLLLFAVFVTVQFQYFFGGQANIQIEGYTYAEYARRGFGELVTVAVFSLFLFLGLSAITRRGEKARKIFSWMGIALVLLVFVILFSALQRLNLYERAYGFSRLRTYSHIFMLWLGALLAAVVVLEVFQKQRRFALAMTLAIVGFAVSLNFLNVDGFIVRQSELRSQEADFRYLSTLSDDMLPALVEGVAEKDMPDKKREELAVVLICHWYTNEADFKETRPWQSFHLSHWRAEQIYAAINPLEGYTAQKRDWYWSVTAPDGEVYDCETEFWD